MTPDNKLWEPILVDANMTVIILRTGNITVFLFFSQADLSRPPAPTYKQDLSDLFDYKYCTDVDLVFQGAVFPVHRAILSSRCAYFQVCFDKENFLLYAFFRLLLSFLSKPESPVEKETSCCCFII